MVCPSTSALSLPSGEVSGLAHEAQTTAASNKNL